MCSLWQSCDPKLGSFLKLLAKWLKEEPYYVAYTRESLEMVLDAHIRAFEFFGGLCRRGIIDNMKAVVVKVLMGKDRVFSRRLKSVHSRSHTDIGLAQVCLETTGPLHQCPFSHPHRTPSGQLSRRVP